MFILITLRREAECKRRGVNNLLLGERECSSSRSVNTRINSDLRTLSWLNASLHAYYICILLLVLLILGRYGARDNFQKTLAQEVKTCCGNGFLIGSSIKFSIFS